MIVGLFLLVVALVAAVLALVVVHAVFVRETTTTFLLYLRAAEIAARDERALLLRAALSRTASEFGQLDRIRQQETPASGVQMSRAEYLKWLEDDIRGGLGGVEDSDIPLVPEGI